MNGFGRRYAQIILMVGAPLALVMVGWNGNMPTMQTILPPSDAFNQMR